MADDPPDGWLRFLSEPNVWSAPAPRPPAIRTKRLVVRLYARGDGPGLFEAIDASRDAILPWMLWASTDHRSVDDSIHYVERVRRGGRAPDATDFPMGIFEQETGKLIGATGLHDIRAGVRQAEIGYWLRADKRGQGLMTEAVHALITAALRPASRAGWGLRRIVIYVPTANNHSMKVCERLGLRREAVMRKERYVGLPVDEPLGYVDTFLYAVLADEWSP